MEQNPRSLPSLTDIEVADAAISAAVPPGENLFVLTKEELQRSTWLQLHLAFGLNDPEYLVVRNAQIMSPGRIYLNKLGRLPNNRGMIFIDSILPGLQFSHTQTGDLLLVNTQMRDAILLYGASGIGDLLMENSSCKNIEAKERSTIGQIVLRDNSRTGIIHLGGGSSCGLVTVTENSECQNIILSQSATSGVIEIDKKSKAGNIIVKANSRVIKLRIDDNSTAGDIEIEHQSLIGDIDLNNFSHAWDIKVSSNSICGDITIKDNSSCGVLAVGANLNLNEETQSGDCSQCGDITFQDSEARQLSLNGVHASLTLQNTQIPLMLIKDCHMHRLEWRTGTFGGMYMRDSVVNHLKLERTSLLKDSVLFISHAKIYVVQMQEFLVQGQLIFRSIAPAAAVFPWKPRLLNYLQPDVTVKDNASPYLASILAVDIPDKLNAEMLALLAEHKNKYDTESETLIRTFGNKDKAIFRLVSSSLNKAEITGSNLEGFEFEFLDSKLLDLFVSDTELPGEKVRIFAENDGKVGERLEAEQKVSLYNQLKKILENQGDNVRSTWYHSKASDNQQTLLRLKLKSQTGATANPTPKKYIFSDERFDLINFKLNRLSSNHGESWRKALYFLFVTAAIFYTLCYIAEFNNRQLSFRGIPNFLSGFVSFLDITHNEKFLHTNTLNLVAKIFDFLGRIMLGYSIYQFIAAFRRHGRKVT